ncbi:MAG: hypothetical protein LBB68_04470 [Treponema sp.]|jgi:hypothetical protein|nr:hypothetical protein [Treponema sp.]
MIKSSVVSILMFQYAPVDCISTTPIGIIGNKAVILEGKKQGGGSGAVLRGTA